MDDVPYQQVLRVIGSWLDRHSWTSVRLLETADGFTVLYREDPADREPSLTHFLYRDLLSKKAQTAHEGHRKLRFLSHPRKGSTGGSYQDLFRALGYELQSVPAYNLLLEELQEGFLLTYLYLDPKAGYLLRKRMVVLGREEMRKLLNVAHARRTRRRTGPLGLLAG